jgi:hypothetical protein
MSSALALGTAVGSIAVLILMLFCLLRRRQTKLHLTSEDARKLIAMLNRCSYIVNADPTAEKIALLTSF